MTYQHSCCTIVVKDWSHVLVFLEEGGLKDLYCQADKFANWLITVGTPEEWLSLLALYTKG